MTVFLHVTDSHLGFPGEEKAFCHHPGRADLVPELIERLLPRLSLQPVDAVIHGGDIIHGGGRETIAESLELWRGSGLPLYLAVGNHDLAEPGNMELWKAVAGESFPASDNGFYKVIFHDCMLCVITNTWDNIPDGEGEFLWNKNRMYELVTYRQLMELDAALSEHEDLPAVILAHAPVFGVDISWSDPDAGTVHKVYSDWPARLNDLLDKYPSARLVLGGHNHITASREFNDRLYLTTGAFMEPPYACRYIEVTRHGLRVETWSAANTVDIGGVFLTSKRWTWGRIQDRELEMHY